MSWQERISISSGVLVGKPVIKGTRLSVECIVGLLAQNWQQDQILENYPGIVQGDIQACLQYARWVPPMNLKP